MSFGQRATLASVQVAPLSLSKPLTVAVIGQGWRGSRVEQAAASCGWTVVPNPIRHAHWVRMPAEIDAIVIGIPSRRRGLVAGMALLHGKHVLSVGPLSHEPSQCRDLDNLAQKRGLVCMTMTPRLFAVPQHLHGTWSSAERIILKRLTRHQYRLGGDVLEHAYDDLILVRHLIGTLYPFWFCDARHVLHASGISGPVIEIHVSLESDDRSALATWESNRRESVDTPPRYEAMLLEFQEAIAQKRRPLVDARVDAEVVAALEFLD